MPQPPGPRKPLRLGLWGPFFIAGIVVIGWSLAWGLAAREVDRRLDASVKALAAQGVAVEWSGKRLYGYPFRLNLDLTDLRVATGETSIRFPRLETQAFLHAPRSWLAAAPRGLTFQRPQGGGLEVEGQRLLASLVLPKSGPPRLSFEGLKLTLSPAPGARPFALASAGRLELHLRPGPDDQAAVFLRLEDATPTAGRLFADLGGGGAVSAAVDARLDHASALRGAGASRALAAWGAAGGRLELHEAGLTAGQARLSLASPGLKASPEGRLEGRLTVTAAKAPSLLVALARHGVLSPVEAAGGLAAVLVGKSGGDDVRLDLDLSDGQVRLAR
ncbi:MAG: hypothetical protein RL588_1334 [Pseudomonadota bacterium]|jgi:hypothetical protein